MKTWKNRIIIATLFSLLTSVLYASTVHATDFSTDSSTWSQESTSSTPSARFGHTGVYSNYGGGNEMIVFGGYGGGNLDDIHILDLDTNAWRKITPGSPDTQDDTGDPLNKCYEETYDESTGVTTQTEVPCVPVIPPKGPAKRLTHTSAYDNSSDTLYIMGGWQYGGVVFRDTWALQGVHGGSPTWVKKKPMPTVGNYGVRNASAVWTGSKIVVFGGIRDDDATRIFGRTMIYDPGSDSWSVINGGPARYGHAAVWANGDMLVFGGRNTGHAYLNDVWVLRSALVSPSWEELISNSNAGEGTVRPERRAGAVGFYEAGKDQMLIFGGDGFGPGYNNDTWMLKDAKNGGVVTTDWKKLSPSGSIPSLRHNHVGVYDNSEDVFVFDGRTNGQTVLNDVYKLHFNVLQYTLTITGGSGNGSVTGNGFDCTITGGSASGDCSETYNSGDSAAILTASPPSGYSFSSWGSSCSGNGTCSAGSMTDNKTVTASFTPVSVEADIKANGGDSATIISGSPATLEWCGTGVGRHACTNATSCKVGTTLGGNDVSVLTSGSPSTGALSSNKTYYLECTNGVSTSYDTVTVTVTPTYTLAVTGGSGNGSVTGNGFDCTITGGSASGDCSETYNSGDSAAALTASPSAGYSFSNWGGACSGNGTCSAGSMTGNNTVTASFSINTHTLTVTKTGTGSGTITGNPAGNGGDDINCGSNCDAPFDHNTSVTLTASFSPGSSFDGWSNCVTSILSTITVTVDAAKTCTAAFKLIPPCEADLKVNDSDSATITSGSTATLEWCGADAHTCVGAASPKVGTTLGGNDISTSISGSWTTPALTADKTYYYECVNAAGNASYDSVAVSVTAVPKPDLIAMPFTTNGVLTAGNSITFSGAIRNQGTANAGVSSARFCVDNASCLDSTTGRVGSSDISVSSLNNGVTSGTLNSSSWTATAGSHTIYWCADTGKSVTESNESNNCTSSTFTVNPALSAEADIKANGADAITITSGSAATLEWCGAGATRHACVNATSCKVGTALGANDISASAISGSAGTGTLTSNKTYYLECVNSVGNTSYDNVAVTVSAPLTNTITITGAGNGSGKVTGGKNSFDTDIDCQINAGVASGNCSKSYDTGTKIELVAKATSGLFSGWTDVHCSSFPGNCNLTLNTDKTATASFNAGGNNAPVADAKVTSINSDPGCIFDPESDAVNEGSQAWLWGKCSTDSDGIIMSHAWSCVGSPALSIDNASGKDTSVTSPLVSSNTTYTCTLTVTDDKGATGTDSITLTVNDIPAPSPDFSINVVGPSGPSDTDWLSNVLIEPTNSNTITLKSKVNVNYDSEISNFFGGYSIERKFGFSGAVNQFNGYLRPCNTTPIFTWGKYYSCSSWGAPEAGIDTLFTKPSIPVSDPDQTFGGKLENNQAWFEGRRGNNYVFEVTAKGSSMTRSSFWTPWNATVFRVNQKPVVDFVLSQSGSQVSITNGDSDGDLIASYEPDASLLVTPNSYNFDKGSRIVKVGVEFDYTPGWLPSTGDKFDKCWVDTAYVPASWTNDNCDMPLEADVPAGGKFWTYTYASPGEYDAALFLEDGLEAYEKKLQHVSITNPSPDLITNSLIINGSLTENTPLTFSGIVRNQGALDAPASNARFCIDNSSCLSDITGQVGTDLAVPLLPGGADSGYLTSNASWTAAIGPHTIHMCADVSASVSESDEANNCTSLPFTISAAPPVLNINLTVSPSSCNGCPSLNPVLTATREATSTTTGLIDYKFDCESDGTIDGTVLGSSNSSESYSGCTYTSSSTASVQMIQQSIPQTDTATISIIVCVCTDKTTRCPGDRADSCGVQNASCDDGTKICSKTGNWREIAP